MRYNAYKSILGRLTQAIAVTNRFICPKDISNGNNFPRLIPSTRRVTWGTYPYSEHQSASGYVYRRLMSNRSNKKQLALGFENIPDSTLQAIFDHYHRMLGSVKSFFLSEETLSGIGLEATSTYTQDGHPDPKLYLWSYAQPPAVESNRLGGIVSLTVVLEGQTGLLPSVVEPDNPNWGCYY